ncbi:sodium/proline symporter PutP [Microbulbifer thermotolerans]|uniref:Sodium/proline symporter n=1 Tax=Microbulbifer thermotolerans TaxID=252514 RepID=A0AB35I133_MICTH|nr:sodium/proline symporter PutP [Microbulbifer thermotolerans]MCX2779922.1 sodium/proline symporter PutP [Microbulbifer thermotolerans]MCX2794717.1 sodium/proline symporter PutP [Microbulbifer thermotolerans]MCX2802804.1 sodium/proline symporter PutP [Microbulbifer thermotolerans]MCX2805229.1 sodium/proline symporter PutP [Microbulbifer thermotolerans]MCX2830907.1 sodium/proline symporter PutP [Microbulbifer thermotolerans]
MSEQWLVSLTFVAYLALILAIGAYAYLRTRNASDYFLGGRSLPPAVAALSAGASDMSGWLLLGLPGAAYTAGLSSSWIAIGLFSGIVISWVSMARRLRIYTYELDDALTVPAYLHRRFDMGHPYLRTVCAVFILLFFLFYVASGLIAGGKLFETVFDWDYRWAVIIGAVAVISYTLFGGFLAVSWTDVFQGLLMSLALVIVPVIVIRDVGGLSAGWAQLHAKVPELMHWMSDNTGQALGLAAIVSSLAWGLGYFGQPHILARFMAVRHPGDVPVAASVAAIWSLFGFIGALSVGLFGHLELQQVLPDGERVFMALVETLFHPLVAGILLAAILSAIMSTADSQLLVSSAALAEDIYHVWWGRETSPEAMVKVGRWAVVALSLIAVWVAMDPDSKVLDVVAYAWAGLGAAFGPVTLISLFWSRMTGAGAIAGVVVGGLTVVIWGQLSGGIFDIYELLPGFVFSAAAIVIVSAVTKCPAAVASRHRQLLG